MSTALDHPDGYLLAIQHAHDAARLRGVPYRELMITMIESHLGAIPIPADRERSIQIRRGSERKEIEDATTRVSRFTAAIEAGRGRWITTREVLLAMGYAERTTTSLTKLYNKAPAHIVRSRNIHTLGYSYRSTRTDQPATTPTAPSHERSTPCTTS